MYVHMLIWKTLINQRTLNRITSPKLSFTNIRGLRWNYFDWESFLESNSPDILALCDTNLDNSIDFGNFCVRGYFPLIWKDYNTHMHGLQVCVKEGLPFAQDLSLENSVDSYYVFDWLYFTLSYFPLSITFFVFVNGFWFYFI